MPDSLRTDTQRMLLSQISKLKEQIEALSGELVQAENAYNATLPKTMRRLRYAKDSTFKQKILYCLKSSNKMLTVSNMVDNLIEVDEGLAEDKLNTAKSIRTQLRRMVDEKIVKAYKPVEFRNIHYGLTEWFDGDNISDDYFL